MPGAAEFRQVTSAKHVEGVSADGQVVGWLALSTDFVDIKGYSGAPLVTLVGLSPQGVITGARVVHHSEPILLVGIRRAKAGYLSSELYLDNAEEAAARAEAVSAAQQAGEKDTPA